METKNLLGKLSLITLLAIGSQSCKKENGIDNNNVIQRPYVLFVADKDGTILKSNDGDNYTTILSGDGSPIRSIVTSKQNILFVKDNRVFLSEDGGNAFNPIREDLVSVPKNVPWSNFMLSIPNLDRVYITNLQSNRGKVSQSPANGKYFLIDSSWTKDKDSAYNIESFTYLDNQILFGYSPSGSVTGSTNLYLKKGKDSTWEPKITDLPSPHSFYLAHKGNTLIASDYSGVKGSYYSDDSGKTFKSFSGLPAGKKLLCTYSAYNIVLIGTEKSGLYITSGTTFTSANGGIDAGSSVYGIVAKDNYYKNGVSKKFFYIATSTGVYRSEDMAKSWIKIKALQYKDVRTIY